MNKTFKKTYVAVGAALTLFAALSLTLTPSIAWALTASAPLTAADGTINLPITGASSNACTSGQRLTLYDNSGVATLKCENNPTDNEGVTSVDKKLNSTGIVVDNSTAATPKLSLIDCDEDQILVAGANDNDYACANQSSVTAIPAIIAFSTETNLSASNTTMYASLGGKLSATNGGVDVQTPLPDGTYKNLVCRTSASVGVANTTVAFKTSTCNNATLTGNVILTLPSSATREDSANTSTTVGTDKCGVIVITRGTAWTTAATITCSLERTS